MDKLFVKTISKEYPIYIESDFSTLTEALDNAGLSGRNVCIVSDENVATLFGKKIVDHIGHMCLNVSLVTFPAGEACKTLETVYSMYDFFLENRLDRKSVIIALGGGVTGDMAGFAAATYMRGIPYVQIPTTLLSQVDSSTGGKTGVDFLGNKNTIGAFYQPWFVYINTTVLNTLPVEQFCSGMAEVIKHGLIKDKNYYSYLKKNKEGIKNLDTEILKNIIKGSCNIKAKVVSEDEKETGIREILNFGHTFGHAIESLSCFKMLHGEAISVGMVAALNLSCKKGHISRDDVKDATDFLQYFQLPICVEGYNPQDIYEKMLLDKKTKENKINLILLKEMGFGYTYKQASKDEITEVVNSIIYPVSDKG